MVNYENGHTSKGVQFVLLVRVDQDPKDNTHFAIIENMPNNNETDLKIEVSRFILLI